MAVPQIHFELFGRARRAGIAVPDPVAKLRPVRSLDTLAGAIATAFLPKAFQACHRQFVGPDLHSVQCCVPSFCPSVVHGASPAPAEIHSATGQIHGFGKSISELRKASADERGR